MVEEEAEGPEEEVTALVVEDLVQLEQVLSAAVVEAGTEVDNVKVVEVVMEVEVEAATEDSVEDEERVVVVVTAAAVTDMAEVGTDTVDQVEAEEVFPIRRLAIHDACFAPSGLKRFSVRYYTNRSYHVHFDQLQDCTNMHHLPLTVECTLCTLAKNRRV